MTLLHEFNLISTCSSSSIFGPPAKGEYISHTWQMSSATSSHVRQHLHCQRIHNMTLLSWSISFMCLYSYCKFRWPFRML